jgi:hypothetical protein
MLQVFNSKCWRALGTITVVALWIWKKFEFEATSFFFRRHHRYGPPKTIGTRFCTRIPLKIELYPGTHSIRQPANNRTRHSLKPSWVSQSIFSKVGREDCSEKE